MRYWVPNWETTLRFLTFSCKTRIFFFHILVQKARQKESFSQDGLSQSMFYILITEVINWVVLYRRAIIVSSLFFIFFFSEQKRDKKNCFPKTCRHRHLRSSYHLYYIQFIVLKLLVFLMPWPNSLLQLNPPLLQILSKIIQTMVRLKRWTSFMCTWWRWLKHFTLFVFPPILIFLALRGWVGQKANNI